VPDLRRVVDVGERLGPGLEGLVDLLALDGPGEVEAVAARGGGDEEGRISWTLFFSPA
jgi:hypothetical protein